MLAFASDLHARLAASAPATMTRMGMATGDVAFLVGDAAAAAVAGDDDGRVWRVEGGGGAEAPFLSVQVRPRPPPGPVPAIGRLGEHLRVVVGDVRAWWRRGRATRTGACNEDVRERPQGAVDPPRRPSLQVLLCHRRCAVQRSLSRGSLSLCRDKDPS